jgi:predicted GH43/DUF377 family glycosyl hydrolase
MRRAPESTRRSSFNPLRPLISSLTVRATPPSTTRMRRSVRRLLVRALAIAGLLAASLLTSGGAAHADYTASNLPDWAIGPFTRATQNPVMSPEGSGWESADVLNPGVVYRNGAFQMLYRAQNSSGVSQVGYASSTDGTDFTRSTSNPVIPNSVQPYESGGVMDPRLYELNGTYYSFVAGYDWSNSPPQTIMETTSTDMVHWTTALPVVNTNYDPSVVTDSNDTPVLMNTKYGPRYVMYYGDSDPAKGRFVAYSTDMVHWTDNTPFNMNFPAGYDPWEICITVTNYQTVQNGPVNKNIVMFVAGTLMAQGKWYYGISEVEFSSSDPTQQIGQLTDAALSPSAPYELTGQTANTVFMNSILFHNGQWYMYYGAADHVIALATSPLRSSSQTPFSSTSFENGQRLPDGVDEVDDSGGQSGGISNVGGYPGYGLTGPETGLRQETAHTGSTALLYSGAADGAAVDYAYTKVFDTSAHPPTIDANTTLSYWIYPQNSNNSTCMALDMIFSDGTALRNLGAVDQNGNLLHPASQCGHLALNQWNLVTAKIGTVAAGKTPVRINLGYDQPGGNGGYRGYVDDISITG